MGWMGPPWVRDCAVAVAIRGTPWFRMAIAGEVKAEGSALTMRVFCRRARHASRRLVTERSCVLFDRAIGDPRRHAHRMPAVAAVERRAQSLPVTIAEFRPPERLAHRTHSFEAGFAPSADLLATANHLVTKVDGADICRMA